MDGEEGALLIADRRNAGIFRSKGPARMGGIVGEIRWREGQLYRMYLRHVPLYERCQQLFAPELLICGEPDNIRDADSRQTRGAFRGLGHQLLGKRHKMTAEGFESRLQFLCQQKLSCLNFSMRIVPRSLRTRNLDRGQSFLPAAQKLRGYKQRSTPGHKSPKCKSELSDNSKKAAGY